MQNVRMTESDRLALVAIACSQGAPIDDAWNAVDALPDDIDLREASHRITATASADAWAGNLG